MRRPMTMPPRTLAGTWVLLAGLTLATMLVGGGEGLERSLALTGAGLVMAFAFVKGRLILTRYMGLGAPAAGWRRGLTAYLLLVCAVILGAYLFGLTR